jgi:hypothetical protein
MTASKRELGRRFRVEPGSPVKQDEAPFARLVSSGMLTFQDKFVNVYRTFF